MRNKIMIITTIIILFVGVACNLSTYLSDTPPYQPKETAQNPSIQNGQEAELSENCINNEVIPSNFSKVSNTDTINTDDISKYIEDAISKIYPGATISAAEMFLSANHDQAISCAVVSPLTNLEISTFDIMANSPDLVTQFVAIPNIELQPSKTNDLISNLGDSRTSFHVELNDRQIQLDIILYRKNDSIHLVSFITKGTAEKHSELIDLASKLK